MESKKVKILLVNPPCGSKTPILPLGLASIAAYLLKNNRDVSVIDAWAEELSYESLGQRIKNEAPAVIGIYMVSPRYKEAKETIETCRKVSPESLIMAGGPHPSAMPKETLDEIKELDVCVVGEGEEVMIELADTFLSSKDFSEIKGIAFRNNNTEIIFTGRRECIKDLDSLPFPARDIFPLSKYKTHPPYGRHNPYFSMMTSRGCPFNCAYCSKDVFLNTYRAVSPKRVCDEIEELIAKYGAKEIHFYDDDFTMHMKRAEEICDEMIERRIKISWSCTTRVDLVNEQLLNKMKNAGCWLISYGVESGNQKILDGINKGYKIEKVISSFALTKKIGILTLGYFMIGLPGETKETIQETLNLAKKIKPDFSSWGTLVVFPGSHFFRLIKEGKYCGKLRNLGEGEKIVGTFFGQGNYTAFEDNLTVEELESEARRANKEFYLRPEYIIQSLKNIRSFSDLIYYLRGGMEVIRAALC